MEYYDISAKETEKRLGTSLKSGLDEKGLERNVEKYGYNKLSERKKRGFFAKLFGALKEPMLVILAFGFVVAFGTSLGTFLRTGEADFGESIGILAAIALSVTITLVMEGSSEKAFAALKRIYDDAPVKVIRNGETVLISQSYLTVGDLVVLETGDKIVADGRLVECDGLSLDESALTGENHSGFKNAEKVLALGTPLAERINSVYSGTFVRTGGGKMIVTAVGDNTEMGIIAGELGEKKEEPSPLAAKLDKLGKIITATGAAAAVFVLILSVVRLAARGALDFNGFQELCISCIILIVAAVPEGLPTIVAVSLAINMIKLAKENALIKKMAATETAGAVSVICSDKTGTLTKNEMTVVSVCASEYCTVPEKLQSEVLCENFILNSTARAAGRGKNARYIGSGTECALLTAAEKRFKKFDAEKFREGYKILYRTPFSSENKYMTTTVKTAAGARTYLKGAPEKVIYMCDLSEEKRKRLFSEIEVHMKKAARIICFAHKDADGEKNGYEKGDTKGFSYDGFAVIKDPVREDVKASVKKCFAAGIKVKMLTGDNAVTAFAVAKELGIAESPAEVVGAAEIEKADDETLKKLLSKVTVVARSTPIIKLRIVKLLKESGEVVAVTGDGINDAPAIRRADVGIAMGVAGSEITKEAADVILLDDGFSTIVKAVAFGRNVYRNLQRFILFQLSVNLSALLFVTVSAIMGLAPPFNAIELLWINVIMDGPPALTLGLESAGDALMKNKPIKRSDGIVSLKMFLRIIATGLFVGGVMIAEYLTDFLGAGNAKNAAIFTLFVLFQLFNAFNCRELGRDGILKNVGKNKVMVWTFIGVFVIHVFIVSVCYKAFGVTPMPVILWIKCVGVAFTVIVASEVYKAIYRLIFGRTAQPAGTARTTRAAGTNRAARTLKNGENDKNGEKSGAGKRILVNKIEREA